MGAYRCVPPATGTMREVFRMPPGLAAVARSGESALTLERMLSCRLETFRQLLWRRKSWQGLQSRRCHRSRQRSCGVLSCCICGL